MRSTDAMSLGSLSGMMASSRLVRVMQWRVMAMVGCL